MSLSPAQSLDEAAWSGVVFLSPQKSDFVCLYQTALLDTLARTQIRTRDPALRKQRISWWAFRVCHLNQRTRSAPTLVQFDVQAAQEPKGPCLLRQNPIIDTTSLQHSTSSTVRSQSWANSVQFKNPNFRFSGQLQSYPLYPHFPRYSNFWSSPFLPTFLGLLPQIGESRSR